MHGTGARHRVKPWPVSAHTGKFNRLDLPPESPDKQVNLSKTFQKIMYNLAVEYVWSGMTTFYLSLFIVCAVCGRLASACVG